jgi:N-acetylneuraminic acid mutarotase
MTTSPQLSWRPAAALPLGLGLPTLFTAGGSIHLTGGDAWVAGGDAPDGQRKIYFDRVLRYDAAGDRWQEVCDLPRPGIHFGAAVWQNRLFVMGGSDGHAMNPDIWVKTLPGGAWQTVGRLEQPAWGDIVVQHEHCLYSFGGWVTPEAGPEQSADLWRYDLRTPDRVPLRLAHLPAEPRSYHAGACCDDGIYVFGGRRYTGDAGAFEALTEAWGYDLRTGTWRRLRDLPAPTTAWSAVALDDRTILLGGGWLRGAAGEGISEHGCLAHVWAYDTHGDVYTRLNDLPGSLCGMSFARAGGVVLGVGGEDRSRHRVDWVWRCDLASRA